MLITHEDLKSKEYKAKCLTGQVPFLETPEGNLFESCAIARYIARQAPEKNLGGSTPFEASLVDQWVDFLQSTLFGQVRNVVHAVFGAVP